LEHPLTDSFSRAPDNSGDGVVELRTAHRAYFPALDGLRALAFLMVFAQHYLDLPWGWAGVDIFFVLSGFLITGILYDSRDQTHRVSNFYIRRTLRIFPLYYGLMFLLLLSYPLFRWQWTWAWLVWPAYVGNFARGIHPFTWGSALEMLADFQPTSGTVPGVKLFFGHFWSLCVEEQFYLIWPWIVFRVRDRRKLIFICLACVVICPLMRVAGHHLLPQYMLDQEVLYRWTPFRVDALLLGGLVALIRRGPSSRRMLSVARALLPVLLSVLVVYVVCANWNGRQDLPTWAHTWGIVFIDWLSACLILTALEPNSICFRIFNHRALRWIGRISYGAYVYHDIFHLQIMTVVSTFTKQVGLVTAVVALAFTLLVAWASFRWFETPFIRLKDRWTSPAPAARFQISMSTGRK
jgi:peptidoglycan/LPS O-acetylase OafA/YrhL